MNNIRLVLGFLWIQKCSWNSESSEFVLGVSSVQEILELLVKLIWGGIMFQVCLVKVILFN